jgi:N-acyl-D-amino-acid deacylase
MLLLGTVRAAEYDLVLRNGRVMDGTGNPWFYADVGIKGDRIAIISERPLPRANQDIDAKGLIVAPGFIDIHSHSDWTLLEDGNAESKIRQGVTTEVIGEGGSVGPFQGKLEPRRVTVKGKTILIGSLSDYFKAFEKSQVSLNVASYTGLDNLWECVMGKSFDRPTPAQFAEMKRLLSEAMDQGSFGLSSQLMMPPGSLITTDEIAELCAVVHERGGLFSSHIRNEGLGIFDSVKEIIEIAERTGVRADVIHLKIADQKYWGRMPGVVDLIEKARQRGLNVQANVYPYTRGNNDLSSIIPPWAHEGGKSKMLERLKNPSDRARIKQEINGGITGWYNHYTAVGGDWNRMLISADHPDKGKTMDQVIAKRSAGISPLPDPLDILFDVLIEAKGSVSTVYAHHTETDMNLALTQPWCSVGSDGSALAIEGPLRRGNPHPRSFGTFPRVLGTYVREKNLLSWEEAIRKMTSLNAARIGLKDRGTLKEGQFADIAVVDPAKVADRSTYTEPFAYSEGIEYVVVNGAVVLDRGRHTGQKPGRGLRKNF